MKGHLGPAKHALLLLLLSFSAIAAAAFPEEIHEPQQAAAGLACPSKAEADDDSLLDGLDEGIHEVSLLQHGLRLPSKIRGKSGECMEKHIEAESENLEELAQRLPGEDLWCYFGYLGEWVRDCASARRLRDYTSFLAGGPDDYGPYLPTSGPEYLVVYEGGAFRTRNNVFMYDDIYCHANGWLRGQGLPEVRNNFTAWNMVQESYCETLAKLNFPPSDLSIANMFNRTEDERRRLWNQVAGIHIAGQAAPTKLEMQRHAYIKCKLGGLGCDMANCHRWCLLPNGAIGRSEQECGPYGG